MRPKLARQLRALARRLEKVTRVSPAFSVASGIVGQASEELQARARIIELQAELEEVSA